MEAKHSAEMARHLEKQGQVLMEAYRELSHEQHKLQVEEETIMRKLYELMSAEGLLKKGNKAQQPEEDPGESAEVKKEQQLQIFSDARSPA